MRRCVRFRQWWLFFSALSYCPYLVLCPKYGALIFLRKVSQLLCVCRPALAFSSCFFTLCSLLSLNFFSLCFAFSLGQYICLFSAYRVNFGAGSVTQTYIKFNFALSFIFFHLFARPASCRRVTIAFVDQRPFILLSREGGSVEREKASR